MHDQSRISHLRFCDFSTFMAAGTMFADQLLDGVWYHELQHQISRMCSSCSHSVQRVSAKVSFFSQFFLSSVTPNRNFQSIIECCNLCCEFQGSRSTCGLSCHIHMYRMFRLSLSHTQLFPHIFSGISYIITLSDVAKGCPPFSALHTCATKASLPPTRMSTHS